MSTAYGIITAHLDSDEDDRVIYFVANEYQGVPAKDGSMARNVVTDTSTASPGLIANVDGMYEINWYCKAIFPENTREDVNVTFWMLINRVLNKDDSLTVTSRIGDTVIFQGTSFRHVGVGEKVEMLICPEATLNIAFPAGGLYSKLSIKWIADTFE